MTMTTMQQQPAQQEDALRTLERKMSALKRDRNMAQTERRRAADRARNDRADRSMSKLKEADSHLASLLSQAAECLGVLVGPEGAMGFRSLDGVEGSDSMARFEARAQEWFMTLNDIQMSLRSAVKTLQDVSKPPQAPVSKAFGPGGGLSAAEAGSAPRGHNIDLLDVVVGSPGNEQGRRVSFSEEGRASTTMKKSISTSSSNNGATTSVTFTSSFGAKKPRRQSETSAAKSRAQDSQLSLGALRLQHGGWRELCSALEDVASSIGVRSGDESGAATPPPRPSGMTAAAAEREAKQQNDFAAGLAQVLYESKMEEDGKLLKALLEAPVPSVLPPIVRMGSSQPPGSR